MELKRRPVGDRVLLPDEGKALLERAEKAEARIAELEAALLKVDETYFTTQTHPTPRQESDCLNVVMMALKREPYYSVLKANSRVEQPGSSRRS